MKIKIFSLIFFIFSVVANQSFGQAKMSQQMAATAMKLWKDSLVVGSSKDGKARWVYQESVLLRGMEELYKSTGDEKYMDFIKHHIDYYINDDGTIRTCNLNDHSIDNIPNGRLLLTLYKNFGDKKYLVAAQAIKKSLDEMPRTHEGGLWHKAIYPWQMWLDGLYMAQPFNAEYTKMFANNAANIKDIANQFIWAEKNMRDSATGLLYHGWDESKGMKWADDKTGRSPQVWGRAMGWYAMALADVPEYMPENDAGRQTLKDIFNRLAIAIQKYQDPKTGVWWQILDSMNVKGNYLESSASCMFVYALAKGVRLGYLPASYLQTAKKGYDGMKKVFVETDANGQVNLKFTCRGAGLGNNPYRSGSFQYYISEPVITNDAHGIGSFIMAANEIEMAEKN